MRRSYASVIVLGLGLLSCRISSSPRAVRSVSVTKMLAGVAAEDVTPQWPVPAEAWRPGDGLVAEHYRNLEVKALAISDGTTPVVIVTMDVVDACTEVSEQVYSRVAHLGLTPGQIVLNSSHIHSTPALCSTGTDVYDPSVLDRRYQAFFVDRTVAAITRAMADLRPADLSTSESQCDICVNRDKRPRTDPRAFAPNPDGPIDRRVRTLLVRDPGTTRLRAVLALFGCHPSDMDTSPFGGDFFGFGRDEVARAHPGVVVLTAQGTGGDVRVAHYKNGDMKQGWAGSSVRNIEPNRDFGRRFGRSIIAAMAEPAVPVWGRIRAGLGRTRLPLQEPESRAVAERAALGTDLWKGGAWRVRWGNFMLSAYDRGVSLPRSVGPYEMRVIHLGDQLTVAALDGEVFTCIGRQVEAALSPPGSNHRTFVLGYTNDVSGYLPCSENFAQETGGYEVNVFYAWRLADGFQPAAFHPTVDAVIVGETVALANRIWQR